MPITALPETGFPRREARFDGFVHADGGRLVDGAGRELLLRGVGLGNWMLPEGYMWGFGPGAESPREIEALVLGLAGAEYAERFWRRFREEFISEADIALIAASGFDHVRLPINSRVIQDEAGLPIEAGYAMIDRLIGWCRKHRLWVLLDLHGAPGGQTGTNIDDSPNALPELFMSEEHRRATLSLWRQLASRYAAETVVLGYDLLNEPLPGHWQHEYADALVALYKDLTAEIRAVDSDHLIMYEGSHWATNWEIFTEVWDANSALQFHKYWSSPDQASIRAFLETGQRLGLPIYMGEGGENTLEWLYTAFRLYETHGIGWNFWPWKKIDTRTSPLSIVPPEGWDAVIASIAAPAALDQQQVIEVFDELLEAMHPERCRWQPQIVAALTAQHPSVIPAWGFGFRGEGVSHSIAEPRPLPGIRAEDAVTLRFAHPGQNPANPFEQSDGRAYLPEERLLVALDVGDWLEFELAEVFELSAARALGPDGADAAVRLERSERGLRVTATEPTALSTIILDAAGAADIVGAS